jgi:hypothetical protein
VSEDKIALGKGDVVAVIYGNTGWVKEYQNHPSVIMLDGKARDSNLQTRIPQNTRAIIFTEGLENLNHAWVMSYCRSKQIPYFLRKGNQAVYDLLKSVLPNGDDVKPTSEEVKDAMVRGKLVPLIPFIDFTKSNAENSKILNRKAKEMQISSTEASLAQFVAIQRRKLSGTAIPKSARPKLDLSVELLDDMIKGLGDMRDFLIATCEENRLLRAKVERFKKVMED